MMEYAHVQYCSAQGWNANLTGKALNYKHCRTCGEDMKTTQYAKHYPHKPVCDSAVESKGTHRHKSSGKQVTNNN